MVYNVEEYSSKRLDHLGIVAAVCDEIKLVEIMNRLIPPDPRAVMSVGECLKLMVINGLGFTSRPLYLEAQFYASKPINRLLGRTVGSEYITDDRLGKALDQCYEYGCEAIFSVLAAEACCKYEVSKKFRHLDTTSIQVEGEYASDEIDRIVTHGFSKDKRPDLKQFMVSLICSQDGDVPLLAQTIAGNSSDKTHFRETLEKLKTQINEETEPFYIVADSALYTEETLKSTSNFMKWISRVPENIKAAREVIHDFSKEEMEMICEGCRATELCSIYAGVNQRWLLVYSDQAFERESKTLDKQIKKELESKNKELKKFASTNFDCEVDAKLALEAFEKQLKYHNISEFEIIKKNNKSGIGRPKKNTPVSTKYVIQAKLAKDDKKINNILQRKGKFIIATNELDEKLLSKQDLFNNYKCQQSVERGFRFLKDPFFMTSSVFLKNQDRIQALSMVMCLCLLVYTIAQRYLRLRLEKLGENVPNQLGKPTTKPTMRWIFQIFEGVEVLLKTIEGHVTELILNLNKTRKHILFVLGSDFLKYYSSV